MLLKLFRGKYLVIVLFVFFYSCNTDKNELANKNLHNGSREYNIEDIIQIENRPLYKLLKDNNKPSGKIYQVLNNGDKKYIGQLSKGIPFGDWKKLNEEGQVLEQVHYSNGIAGRKYVALYHENGKKSLEGSYLNDKKNGLFAMYYENGVRSFRGEYRNGIGIGIWIYYDQNSAVIKKIDCSEEKCN